MLVNYRMYLTVDLAADLVASSSLVYKAIDFPVCAQ